MTLPGLFIEYLVSGAIALLWLSTYLPADAMAKLQAWHAPVVGAFLYVLGMSIDLIAFVSLRPIKWQLRRLVAARKRLPTPGRSHSETERLAFINKGSATISSEVAARSSRDRIARCTLVNAILFSLIGNPSLWTTLKLPQPPAWSLVLLCLFILGMWLFFEASSYVYQIKAAEVLGYVHNKAKHNAV